ncbi:hypothetical protein [Paracoccus sp. S1E-3]|nr:hypothetical protein [Paracoccus sp. S1E-3]MBA4490098.1 hypothetical protein [Paracoccus sp. S1E-3]
MLMLPGAIWLIVQLRPAPVQMIWVAMGIAAMMPLLMLVWRLAIRRDI